MTVDYPHIPKSFDTITPISADADLAHSAGWALSPRFGDRIGEPGFCAGRVALVRAHTGGVGAGSRYWPGR